MTPGPLPDAGHVRGPKFNIFLRGLGGNSLAGVLLATPLGEDIGDPLNDDGVGVAEFLVHAAEGEHGIGDRLTGVIGGGSEGVFYTAEVAVEGLTHIIDDVVDGGPQPV